jgi:hypothetical protein
MGTTHRRSQISRRSSHVTLHQQEQERPGASQTWVPVSQMPTTCLQGERPKAQTPTTCRAISEGISPRCSPDIASEAIYTCNRKVLTCEMPLAAPAHLSSVPPALSPVSQKPTASLQTGKFFLWATNFPSCSLLVSKQI